MSTFDNFINKAMDITNSAGKKTDEYIQTSKLKFSAAQIRGELKSKYENLGSRAYEGIKAGESDFSQLADLIEGIDSSLAQLKEISDKIEELKGAIPCPKCGFKNKVDSEYCSKCGSAIEIPVEQPEQTVEDRNIE